MMDSMAPGGARSESPNGRGADWQNGDVQPKRYGNSPLIFVRRHFSTEQCSDFHSWISVFLVLSAVITVAEDVISNLHYVSSGLQNMLTSSDPTPSSFLDTANRPTLMKQNVWTCYCHFFLCGEIDDEFFSDCASRGHVCDPPMFKRDKQDANYAPRGRTFAFFRILVFSHSAVRGTL